MITDLLLAGLLLASSPDLSSLGSPHPAPVGLRSDARQIVQACTGDSRTPGQQALLEAHAAYAALHPFSLVRIPPAAGAKAAPGGKGIAGCKS